MLNNEAFRRSILRRSLYFGSFVLWCRVQGIGFDGIAESALELAILFLSSAAFFASSYVLVGYIVLNRRRYRHYEQDSGGGDRGSDNSTENEQKSKPRQVG